MKFLGERGDLTFIDDHIQICFKTKRTYWLFDVWGKVGRHAHDELRG